MSIKKENPKVDFVKNELEILDYWSKNKKYYLRTHYANQKLFAEQNGGIANSDIENFENGVNQYLDRGVFDPNFENAHNELLGKRFYIDQVYKFHKNDTLNKSRIEVYNSVLIEEKQYKFQQSTVDEFFGEGFSIQQVNDKTFLNTFKIKAGLNYKSGKLGDITAGLIFRDEKYSLQNFEIISDPRIKDVTAETTKPLYKAFITFLLLPNLTKKVPSIDVKIQAPPIVKG